MHETFVLHCNIHVVVHVVVTHFVNINMEFFEKFPLA